MEKIPGLEVYKFGGASVKDAAAILNLCRIVRDFGIGWVRMPFDSGPARSWPARLMRTQRGRLRLKLNAAGARTTDNFVGFALTGYLDEAKLLALIPQLAGGITELMCHPGYCREELRASRTRLQQSRETELNALTAPAVRAAIDSSNIQLANYRT